MDEELLIGLFLVLLNRGDNGILRSAVAAVLKVDSSGTSMEARLVKRLV